MWHLFFRFARTIQWDILFIGASRKIKRILINGHKQKT